MKTQYCSKHAPGIMYKKYLWAILIALFILPSCIDWDSIGGGGGPIDNGCELSPSLFDGTYLVSKNNCDAKWLDSNYDITLAFTNNIDECEWSIQNLLNTGKAVDGIYDFGSSVLKIYPQNFIEYWVISGEVARNANTVEIDITITSTILDSVVTCSITGTKH